MTPVTQAFLKDIKSTTSKQPFYMNEYADKLNTTWSKVRTAFNYALDKGYIVQAKTVEGKNLFKRTRKTIKF